MSDRIGGLHHITLCTGTAQGDVNFFVKTLGMNLVKRTLLYDGREPVYHLYFSDATGSPGNLTTCFPWRRTGRKARAGTGQIALTSYTVPTGSLEFWQEHLRRNQVNVVQQYERFGQKVLKMEHPDCPVLHFELVEDGTDKRNALLNYGYAVIRSAVARALVAAGLLPAFGVYHASVSNAFNLADDLVEPFRPFIDRLVWQMTDSGRDRNGETTVEQRRLLASAPTEDARMGKEKVNLLIASERAAESLVRAMEANSAALLMLPRLQA